MNSLHHLEIPDLDERAFVRTADGRIRLYKSKAGDGGAGELRRQEDEKQARINAGTTKVTDAFGQYGDDYYSNVSKAFMDYHNPLISEQFNEAARGLPAQFGSTAGSEYNRAYGNLIRDRDRELVGLQDRAKSFADQQRQNVENSRASLLSQVQAGAGIESVGQQAISQAASLTKPPAYSPIGDLFSKYTSNLANYAIANQQGQRVQNQNNSSIYGTPTNAKVIR